MVAIGASGGTRMRSGESIGLQDSMAGKHHRCTRRYVGSDGGERMREGVNVVFRWAKKSIGVSE